MGHPTACFVSASGQNAYFAELLEALRTALEEAGLRTETAVDHFPAPAGDRVCVFVPHEYLPFTLSAAHPTREQLRRSVAVMTEQPGTPWFEKSAAVAVEAGAAVEIHPAGLTELARRGVSAQFMPLGYVPAWDRWQESARPRPVDYTFMGQFTPRREGVLASGADYLHRWTGSLHLAQTHSPNTATATGFLAGTPKWDHLAASRALLNVHRTEQPYFEWLRIIEAMANGCVVVSEHSTGYEPLVPGEHFLSADAARLPLLLDSLLDDDDRVRRIREAAYAFLRDELPLARSAEVLANAIVDVTRSTPAPSSAREGDKSPETPLRAPKPERKPRYVEVREAHHEANDAAMMRLALKQLVLGQRDLARRLTESDAPAEPTVHTRGPYTDVTPTVSVAITVYNYAGYVREALASVALSDRRDLEVVLVDDGSSDDSLRVVEEALDSFPWLAAKVVAHGRNRGLPVARNSAFEHARGEYVFVLDADNAVYPKALDRLADALEADTDAAFAYGLLALFDSEGGRGIFSWPEWDPHELRYGNYIDAMAMVRRSAWEAVGGYTDDLRLYGWEDFALWCAFAQRGWNGVRVPDILGRYRKGRHSMLSVTDIDHAEAWGLLVERYPILTQRGPQSQARTAGVEVR